MSGTYRGLAHISSVDSRIRILLRLVGRDDLADRRRAIRGGGRKEGGKKGAVHARSGEMGIRRCRLRDDQYLLVVDYRQLNVSLPVIARVSDGACQDNPNRMGLIVHG